MPITRHPLYDDPRSESPAPLDEGLVRRLEASFEGLERSADVLAVRFYDRLFAREPRLRAMFPAEMADQRKKLVSTLAFVVKNLRSPEQVLPCLKELGASHTAFGARRAHYPIVCEELLAAMEETAGGAWNEEIEREWASALHLLSAAMLAGAA
jgi:hemoglobin-like flavoprotein